MKAIIFASRNNFLEKKFVLDLEVKIQAVGYEITEDFAEAKAAVAVSDGRDLPQSEQMKLKNWLKDKEAVKPHKLFAIYHIADEEAPEKLTERCDFITKELYSLIGCLKDYWYFTHHETKTN
jgi:hypothetical protein